MIQLEPTHSILSRLQTVPGTRVSQPQLKHVLLTQAIAQGPSVGDHLLTGQVFPATSPHRKGISPRVSGTRTRLPDVPLPFPRDCSQSRVQAQLLLPLVVATHRKVRAHHSEAGGSQLGHFLPWQLSEELLGLL